MKNLWIFLFCILRMLIFTDLWWTYDIFTCKSTTSMSVSISHFILFLKKPEQEMNAWMVGASSEHFNSCIHWGVFLIRLKFTSSHVDSLFCLRISLFLFFSGVYLNFFWFLLFFRVYFLFCSNKLWNALNLYAKLFNKYRVSVPFDRNFPTSNQSRLIYVYNNH